MDKYFWQNDVSVELRRGKEKATTELLRLSPMGG